MTAALREETWRRYHEQGETPRRIAWELEIHFDEVMEIVRNRPLPTCRRPGCEREVRRPEASYCSKSCQWSAMTEAERPVGCGCTDIKLCPAHGAMLRRMQANERRGT